MSHSAQLYRLHSPDLLRMLMQRTGAGTSVTTRTLAQAAGCAHGTVGNLLTGIQQCVPLATASGIADRIGVDLLVLFTPTGRSVRVPAAEIAALAVSA